MKPPPPPPPPKKMKRQRRVLCIPDTQGPPGRNGEPGAPRTTWTQRQSWESRVARTFGWLAGTNRASWSTRATRITRFQWWTRDSRASGNTRTPDHLLELPYCTEAGAGPRRIPQRHPQRHDGSHGLLCTVPAQYLYLEYHEHHIGVLS